MSVAQLTDSNYSETLKDSVAVVKFYADWCGSCRLFAPKFKRIAESESLNSVGFYESNAEENPTFRKTAEVTNLPYFAVYKNGEFQGGISTAKEEALVEFIEAKRG